MPKVRIQLVSLLAIFALFAGCALVPSTKSQVVLLEENISKFNNFEMSGVISINYQQFVIRKQIHINKDASSFSAIIVEGGIFGMQAEPFFSLEITDIGKWSFAGEIHKSPISIQVLNSYTDLTFIRKHQKEILKDRKLILKDTTITWNELMQISSISKEDFRGEIVYDLNGNIDKINIFRAGELASEILIDEVKYK